MIVTGRCALDGLVALNGPARLTVDVLDESTAAAVLHWSLGPAWADAEPQPSGRWRTRADGCRWRCGSRRCA